MAFLVRKRSRLSSMISGDGRVEEERLDEELVVLEVAFCAADNAGLCLNSLKSILRSLAMYASDEACESTDSVVDLVNNDGASEE